MGRVITIEVETVIFEGVELIGVRGIKQFAHVGSAAVSNWQKRHADFPKPVIDLQGDDPRAAIRLWRFTDIETWLKGR